MTKTLHTRVDKKIIPTYPREVFSGRIFTITTLSETEQAVQYLMSHQLLGFDTETRPSFNHGENHKVALLQVATLDTCFLFRLNLIDLPPSIIRLLEDTTITKVGLSWHDDLHMLLQRKSFKPGTFIDLQSLVGKIGIEDYSLQKIYANLFQRYISKRQQLSNWEADILSEPQKAYAALDAWACVIIYQELQRLIVTQDYQLIPFPPTDLSVPDNP